MSKAEDFARVVALFDQLVDLPPEQQKPLLQSECADNAELLAELRGLLDADQRVGAMTARPIVDELAQLLRSASPQPSFQGLRLGAFEVREELGHGGMGVVHRAERVDGTLEQQVAIKFVRREMLSSDMRARFVLERQTLAAMDHPNIARLIDAAEMNDGIPYYVMEYVNGVPITDYCRQRGLSVRERIELFRPVCEAVAYAHRSLVVHRDLKPGNILVTAEGVPKLLDFGIAKLLMPEGVPAASEQTATEQRYFSPLYAAPEQLLGEPIGVGCDVYALGLLLCECLTDARAFDFSNLSAGQIERLITSVPPSAPSQIAAARGASVNLRRQLRGELDDIVLRCLRKAPEERYSSVEQLSLDLENYLQGRPVRARGGHFWYRSRKFVRRNLIPVAACSLAVLALIGGIIGFATQARVAQQRAAELDRVSAFQASMLNAMDPAAAGRLLNDYARQGLAESLETEGLSESEREIELDRFQGQWARLNSTDLARRMVDDTILKPSIAAIEREFPTQPAVAGQLYQGISETYMKLGLVGDALPVLEQALALRREALGEDHPKTLITMTWLGELYFRRKDFEQAQQFNRVALAGLRRVYGDDHDYTISAMVSLSASLSEGGAFEEGEVLALEALERGTRALGEDHVETLRALARLGYQFLRQGRLADAEPYLRRVLQARIRTLGPDSVESLMVMHNLGYVLREQGKLAEAEAIATEAVRRWKSAHGSDHPETASATLGLALILQRQNKFEESIPHMQAALNSQTSAFGRSNANTLKTLSALGTSLLWSGQLAEAEATMLEALELGRRDLGPDHAETLTAVQNLAALRLAQNDPAQALALLSPIEEATRNAFGTRKEAARFTLFLGSAHLRLKAYQSAEAYLLESRELFDGVVDLDRLETDCRLALEALYGAWKPSRTES